MKTITDMLSQNDFDTLRQIIREEIKDIREEVKNLRDDINELRNEQKKQMGYILSIHLMAIGLQNDMKVVKEQLAEQAIDIESLKGEYDILRVTHGRAFLHIEAEIAGLKGTLGLPTPLETPSKIPL